MPLFFVTGWLLYLDRRRKNARCKDARKDLAQPVARPSWLIGFASQSGFAEQLAWQTPANCKRPACQCKCYRWRRSASRPAPVRTRAVRGQHLRRRRGTGQRPWPSSARCWGVEPESLNYAVLGLGDRQYQHFCGFARRLHTWLGEHGGKTLFAPVEVDSGDPYALRHWQQHRGC
jgi:sulfite reductase (NADPH) flavoprotein alpha-component